MQDYMEPLKPTWFDKGHGEMIRLKSRLLSRITLQMKPGTYRDNRVQWGRDDADFIDLPHPVTLLSAAPFGWRVYTPGGVYEIDTRTTPPEVR